jgi:UDP-N-acetylglucosamine 2-epimerase
MAREQGRTGQTHFYRNFSPEDYARLIHNAACVVGNSSSALREGAFLGVPAVNVGTRQAGREHGPNIAHVGYDRKEIAMAVESQLAHGRYPRSLLFGDGHAGKRIADVLASADLKIEKKLSYQP